jgi:hypothetical protein
MTNLKDSAARTKIGPHNLIVVAIEDLPEAERRALEKELEEGMVEARRRKLACFQKNTHGGDQENCPGHYDHSNRYIYGNS